MGPGAAVGEIEVIAPRLGLESRGAVGGDPVPEAAVDALELARPADLVGQVLIAPDAVDEHAHERPPSREARKPEEV